MSGGLVTEMRDGALPPLTVLAGALPLTLTLSPYYGARGLSTLRSASLAPLAGRDVRQDSEGQQQTMTKNQP